MTATEHDVETPTGQPRRYNLLGRAAGWVQRDHLRRGPLPVIAGATAAVALAHQVDAPSWPGIPLTLAATVGMYAREMNLPGQRTPARTALATLAAGSWMSAATEWGLTAGPSSAPGLMGILGAATAGLTYWAYRKDPAIQHAIAWEQARIDWHAKAASYGLAGSHLLEWRETRLGEQFELDTRGTGKRASALAGHDLEERIAEVEMLRPTRVKTKPYGTSGIAGRLLVSIRYKDPWGEDLPHPLLDPTPEIVLPGVADAREPRIIGMDPETGSPLEVVLWDEEGAKRVLVVASPGSGKSVLLNDLLERETAADNSFPIGINVSKAKELRRWRPALGASACGPHERLKAFYLLNMGRHIIDYRGFQDDADSATVEPSADVPLVPVFVDEMDELLGHSDQLGQATRKELEYVSTKGRSEGVPWVLVGTRAITTFTGGGTNRAMTDSVILGRVARRAEMTHAAGELGVVLPEMSRYGEGKAGVHLVVHIPTHHWDGGRTWRLEKLTDIDRLARGRHACPLEPGLMAYLNEQMGEDLVAALLSTGPFTPPSKKPRPAPSAPVAASESSVPDTDDRPAKAAAARARAAANLAHTPAPSTLTRAEQRAMAAQRRKDAAAHTVIPPEVRALILRLLAEPDGVSTRQIEAAMRAEFGHERGTSKDSAWRYLDVLRFDGVAVLRGAGGGRRWHLAAPAEQAVNVPEVDVEMLIDAAEDEALDTADEHEE